MIDSMKRMINRTGHALSATKRTLTRYVTIALAVIATVFGTQAAHASSTGATAATTATFTIYDTMNSILNIIYPAVIPILIAGSTIFAAWWVWHRLRGAVS